MTYIFGTHLTLQCHLLVEPMEGHVQDEGR